MGHYIHASDGMQAASRAEEARTRRDQDFGWAVSETGEVVADVGRCPRRALSRGASAGQAARNNATVSSFVSSAYSCSSTGPTQAGQPFGHGQAVTRSSAAVSASGKESKSCSRVADSAGRPLVHRDGRQARCSDPAARPARRGRGRRTSGRAARRLRSGRPRRRGLTGCARRPRPGGGTTGRASPDSPAGWRPARPAPRADPRGARSSATNARKGILW